MVPVLLSDTVTTDLSRAIDLTLLWGLEGMELRTLGSADARVPYINERALRLRLMENDVTVEAVAPSMFEGLAEDKAVWLDELARFRETLQFCERIACPRVVISAFAATGMAPAGVVVDALQRAGEVAQSADVRVGVLNEAEMAHATGRALAELLEEVGHPYVRAAWSPADAVQSGESPEEGLAALGEQVELVRCSDGELRDGFWRDTMLGEGTIGWTEHLRQLADQGFDGPISLEVYLEPRRRMGLRMATRLVEWIQSL